VPITFALDPKQAEQALRFPTFKMIWLNPVYGETLVDGGKVRPQVDRIIELARDDRVGINLGAPSHSGKYGATDDFAGLAPVVERAEADGSASDGPLLLPGHRSHAQGEPRPSDRPGGRCNGESRLSKGMRSLYGLLCPDPPRRIPAHRALSIAFRTAHLATFGTLLGGHVFGVEPSRLLPFLVVTIASGAALMALELASTFEWLLMVKGLAVVLKLLLLAMIPIFWSRRVSILLVIVTVAAISSHMPARLRHYHILRRATARPAPGARVRGARHRGAERTADSLAPRWRI
jgi:hypothetical protein